MILLHQTDFTWCNKQILHIPYWTPHRRYLCSVTKHYPCTPKQQYLCTPRYHDVEKRKMNKKWFYNKVNLMFELHKNIPLIIEMLLKRFVLTCCFAPCHILLCLMYFSWTFVLLFKREFRARQHRCLSKSLWRDNIWYLSERLGRDNIGV
jgi:hypothetical protein